MEINVRNKKYAIFAWTISPRTGTTTLAKLKESYISYIAKYRKKIKKHAYALELGKNADHPHIHVLCEYEEPTRIADKRRHLLRS